MLTHVQEKNYKKLQSFFMVANCVALVIKGIEV